MKLEPNYIHDVRFLKWFLGVFWQNGFFFSIVLGRCLQSCNLLSDVISLCRLVSTVPTRTTAIADVPKGWSVGFNHFGMERCLDSAPNRDRRYLTVTILQGRNIYIYWQLHRGRTLSWTFLVPFSHFGVIDFIIELSYAEWFQALNMRTFLVYVHVF